MTVPNDPSARPVAIVPNPDGIPQVLKDASRWGTWTYVKRNTINTDSTGARKPWSKRPYRALGVRPAKTNDPDDWMAFKSAWTRFTMNLGKAERWRARGETPADSERSDGVGFLFVEEDGFTGVDLDDCRNPETGEIAPWAWEIIRSLDSYTEVSPSGTGVKVIVRGYIAGGGRQAQYAGGKVEVYSSGRYFTVTGMRVEGTPPTVGDGQAALDALVDKVFPPAKKVKDNAAINAARQVVLWVSDGELLVRMRRHQKTAALLDGDTSGHKGDHSRADLALANRLCFWTGGDHARMDAIFQASGLMRDKWNEKRGERTYGERTLTLALRDWDGSCYDPNYRSSAPTRDSSTPTVGGEAPAQEAGQPPTSCLALEPGSTEPDPSVPTDPGPFPACLLDVPGFIADVVQYTLATSPRPQPVLALAGALALMGVLAGRKVRDEQDARTNVYIIAVAPSGSGKDRPRQVNKKILLAAGADHLIGPESWASHTGLVNAVAQQPAILFQVDEIGRVLKTAGDPKSNPHLYGIITKLLKLYSESNTLYKGDAYADTGFNLTIQEPCACLFGTTVPRSLYEGFSMDSVTDGFLGRIFLFESSEIPKKQRVRVAQVPARIVEVARWWVDFRPAGNLTGGRGTDINPNPREVPITEEARAMSEAFDQEADATARALGEPYESLWTRASEQANKLALLYACSRDHENPVIDEDAIGWAVALSKYLTARMAYLAEEHITEGEFDARRMQVLRVVRRAGAGGISMTRLGKAAKTYRWKKKDREDVYEALITSGEIRIVQVTDTGGRNCTMVYDGRVPHENGPAAPQP